MWPLSYLSLEVGICALAAQNSGSGPLRGSELVQRPLTPTLSPLAGSGRRPHYMRRPGPPGSVADDTRPSVV